MLSITTKLDQGSTEVFISELEKETICGCLKVIKATMLKMKVLKHCLSYSS